jgi:hypothetical protein
MTHSVRESSEIMESGSDLKPSGARAGRAFKARPQQKALRIQLRIQEKSQTIRREQPKSKGSIKMAARRKDTMGRRGRPARTATARLDTEPAAHFLSF